MSGQAASPNAKKKSKDEKEKKKWLGLGQKMKKFRGRESEKASRTSTAPPQRGRTKTELVPHTPKTLAGTPALLKRRSYAHMSADTIGGASDEPVPIKELIKPQFGITPQELHEKYPNESIPAVLVACISILEEDIRKEGLFRIPGKMTNIVAMKDSFEQGNGLCVEEPCTLDIAGLVSQFFRELPDPLLTNALYYKWIEIAKTENEEGRRGDVIALLNDIPPSNYETLKFFVGFLSKVSKSSGANRMGARNLALIFGASLLNPPSIDEYDLQNIKLQCSVVEYLINSFTFIFEGAEGDDVQNRAKEVATIPAGNPGTPAPVGPGKERERFLRRKSTRFDISIPNFSSRNDGTRKKKDKDTIDDQE